MPPYIDTKATGGTAQCTGVLNETDAETVDGGLAVDIGPLKQAEQRKLQLVWRNIILFAYVHMAALYGGWLFLTAASWYTVLFAIGLYYTSIIGITAGAHRLWAHRSYKARLPLRVLLIILNTIAFQDCALHWARDHRVHHKYSETDADPHNATRGFFFSHIGWLLCRKHPDVVAKGRCIDITDLLADPVLRFQRKYYAYLMPLLCFVLPTVIPVYGWGESWTNAWFCATMFRWTLILNVTWCVNSAAHKWGARAYDRNINPSNNFSVSAFALGEGFHNYHHVFPWDYKTAELHNYRMNVTTAFIDVCARIGWAYDLKSVSSEIIEQRVRRTGDGSHNVWGWGDVDQDRKECEAALISHKKRAD